MSLLRPCAVQAHRAASVHVAVLQIGAVQCAVPVLCSALVPRTLQAGAVQCAVQRPAVVGGVVRAPNAVHNPTPVPPAVHSVPSVPSALSNAVPARSAAAISVATLHPRSAALSSDSASVNEDESRNPALVQPVPGLLVVCPTHVPVRDVFGP